MLQAALVFLDDPLARKLAVAWSTNPKSNDTWIRAAGIPSIQRARALQLCECLKANGICTEDGVVDDMAIKYITAIVAQPLKEKRRK